MAYKTFQYRIYPTAYQVERLQNMLDVCRAFYNMCLEERKVEYEFNERSLSKFDQMKNIKFFRVTIPAARSVPVIALRGAATNLDGAYKAFFRRIKSGEKEKGFPSFRRYKDDHTIYFPEWVSISIVGRRIQVNGIGRKGKIKNGRIRIFWHRELIGTPKSAQITRKADGWYVSIVCEVPDVLPLPETNRAIGLDLGIHHLLADSEGEFVDAPKWYQEAQANLRVLQRKLDRQKRVNNPHRFNENGTFKKGRGTWVESGHMTTTREQLARLHLHIKRQREDFIDRLVYRLTRDYDLIAVEDLTVKNMVRNKHLAKSILNQGWGYLVQRLHDKAAETGSTIQVVNPAYTSRTCSNCDKSLDIPKSFKGLSVRWVTCDCGMSLDRDHNAALNVLKRAGYVREGIT